MSTNKRIEKAVEKKTEKTEVVAEKAQAVQAAPAAPVIDEDDEDEEEEVTAETQGRGGPRGARHRFYMCIALRNAGGKPQIVYDPVQANDAAEAAKIFTAKHGMAPEVCDGTERGKGWYISMGTGMSEAQRISVTVTPEQLMSRTSRAIRGQFRGWNVWGSGLKGCTIKVGAEKITFKDNELYSIEFGDRVDSKSKVEKPKLKKKEVVRFSDLQNIQVLGQ